MNTLIEQDLRQKAARIAACAIGNKMTVVLSKERNHTTKVTGEIVEASFARFGYTGRAVYVVFEARLKLEGGQTRQVFVRHLPQ